MIVNATIEGWEIIYQQPHALLAAQIGFYWRQKDRPERWMETLAAIAQHDDGQKDWTGKDGITKAGAPADFTLAENTLEQAHQVMHEARFQGRYRSLLTSMHMSFLYESRRGESKDIDAFLDEQLRLQKSFRKDLQLTKKEADAAYALMQWCDRFSLILCRNELPEMERLVEISKGPDGKRYELKQLETGAVVVTPWPFELPEFEVWVEACTLKQLQFKNDAELAEALRQSPISTKRWQLKKGEI